MEPQSPGPASIRVTTDTDEAMLLNLNKLHFKASPGLPALPTTVTVLVGPNNSGKSLALREIAAWAAGDDQSREVIGDIDVEWPGSADEAMKILEPLESERQPGEAPPPDAIAVSSFRPDGENFRNWIAPDTVHEQLLAAPGSSWLRQNLLSHFVARLDGRARFALVTERPLQDQQKPPEHHLAGLFLDDDRRARVRAIVAKAFPGRYFVIDPTGMQSFRVRMSDRSPADGAEERGWDDRAKQFHGEATLIDDLSDGVVCFTGLVAASVSLRQRILLVDEPEAFLHPPLARLLGSSLGELTKERDAHLIAATHSAEFLMGCIESGADTTIVRLTFEQDVPGSRVLSPAELRPLIQDPLLRSTKALSGLFHRGVIVGESDHDRALYDEINRRLLADGRGGRDVFFTNAQNWSTVARIIAPLRKLGVPAVAILDLDTLTGTKGEWTKFYDAAGLNAAEQTAFEERRNEVSSDLKALGKLGGQLKCKTTGIAGLKPADKKKATALLNDLGRRGIFIVPKGELECWLSSLNVRRQAKGKWIVAVFKALGSSPGSSGYVPPKSGDVWKFLDEIASWINDPNRLGLPA